MADIKFIPGVHPTYRQQFDRITEAYINGEIRPFRSCFCFCGTLAGGEIVWEEANPVYSSADYGRMEKALLLSFEPLGLIYNGLRSCRDFHYRFMEGLYDKDDRYEDFLFIGLIAALDVLKQIHIEHGEIIDEVPAFTKRELKTA